MLGNSSCEDDQCAEHAVFKGTLISGICGQDEKLIANFNR